VAESGDGARRLDSTVWFGVGIIGTLLFILGIWNPAFASIHFSSALQIVIAFAGGVLAYVGFSWGYDAYQYEKRHPRQRAPRGRERELSIAPSLEIYNPNVGEPAPPPPPPDPPE
jgi:hypothetical protein